jgi:ligand-binding sensor domain-containing protein
VLKGGIKMIKVVKERLIAIINTILIAFFFAGQFTSVTTAQTSGTVQSFGEGISAKKFYSSTIDENNTVWFLTESGILSFDGTKWTLHNKNQKVTPTGAQGIAYDFSSVGHELLLATPQGATVASLPIDAKSGVKTFNSENSKILSNNILALAIGQRDLRWFGTDKGISGLNNGKWLTNSYDDTYPELVFQIFPITAMATSINGDSLYIGSKGGGVMRVYRNDLDAISGASEYVGWGPILMPSDTVYSIHISADGTQWIGTNRGVAKHTGYKTLEGWTVFTTADGLADDFVQAINSDSKGNIYFGTKNGLSVFDGTKWITYKIEDGLAGNRILTIAVDKKDVIWLGTDNGVSNFRNGKYTSYR